ncbi:neurexin 1 [Homo sapiens]|uniref:Neurexin 1 n=1 Tax=Homo sapiens TaxID=9606 RepID=A0A0D9SEJ1_HUMAN|nr:neurexin 1 [Homo sapiens]KAI4034523.1 neurexin 1 [Homo sapiens]
MTSGSKCPSTDSASLLPRKSRGLMAYILPLVQLTSSVGEDCSFQISTFLFDLSSIS